MDSEKYVLPVISVVTVSYNARTVIEKTIQSILSQSYSKIEYIVVDGGSTDGTVDIIKQYEDRISYWISKPDKGIYDAMNWGVSVANGEWIIFMNCGDSFVDDNVLMNLFSTNNNIFSYDVIYGDAILNISETKFLVRSEPLDMIKFHLPFCHQSVFCRLALLKEYSFNLKYKLAADYDLFYKLYKNGCRFIYVDIAISNYCPEGGASASNSYKCYCEIKEISLKEHGHFIYYYSISMFYIKEMLINIIPQALLSKIRNLIYMRNSRMKKII